jgi:hypothetical protein
VTLLHATKLLVVLGKKKQQGYGEQIHHLMSLCWFPQNIGCISIRGIQHKHISLAKPFYVVSAFLSADENDVARWCKSISQSKALEHQRETAEM